MERSASCVLDQDTCESCKHLFTEKDDIIDDLKRNLLTQENQVQNLENEVKNLEENLVNVVEERNALRQGEKQLSATKDTSDESEKDKSLEILQDQLIRLEEEKKYLDEKIHDFEHETAGLARMFGMQQEKFEYEMKNKDKTIKAVEKERKGFVEELETTVIELEKVKKETEVEKQVVKELKTSIQEKDEEVLNISNLHDEAKKLVKDLEEQVVVCNGNLKTELSKNEVLEDNISSYIEDIEVLGEENRRLKAENNHLGAGQVNLSEEKGRVEEELQRLNDHIECLENEIKENTKNYVRLEECNEKLKQGKNETEIEVRRLEKVDVELRTDIEKLKKEIVLVKDQKNALESKMSLVQAEIKNVECLKEKLQQELYDLHKSLEKTEEKLKSRTIEKEILEEDVKALEQVISDLKSKNEQQDKCLEKTEENLERESKEKEKLQEEVMALGQVINDLSNDIKQQNKRFDEAKQELDSVIGIKQQLLLQVKNLEDANKDMKIKISTLSQDIENLHGVCATKAKKLEDLERIVNAKSRIILSLEKKEKELQNNIEELLSMEEICSNELKNAKSEVTKLRKENVSIDKNCEKVTAQLQECMQELSQKNEMYTKSRILCEKQVEELSRFREHNAEINDELRNRNDEMSLLTMEKDELLRELGSVRNLLEKNSLMQSNLNKEVEAMKKQVEKYMDNEKEALEKLTEAKRKHDAALRQLDSEKDEKNDLESELKYIQEKGERWKRLSFEIKEERNRLQMQIAELDRDLNEKHSNLAEEKSSLEKEMGTLKKVVERLKSNEENLRRKIDELRDEVDKLSDMNSEQEMEYRKLSLEKERMAENLVKFKNVEEENVALQNECKEINCDNTNLKNNIHVFQEKARNAEDENERLHNELKILQDQFDVMQGRAHEASRECKQLKNDFTIVQDNNSELIEEKERLFNENCRLKEKKISIIQERNKLQDMIESLDKCHNEKNDALSRQNALLENELASRRSAVKRCEEKELRLLNEIQELNEKIEKSIEENDKISCLIKKTDGENIRLRKKVADLVKMAEQIHQERESRMNLETELHGKEQVLTKFKESKKKLTDLVATLNQEQNQLKIELRNKEKELNDLNNDLGTEQSDKFKLKSMMIHLEEELQTTKARELKCINEIENEKEKNEQVALILNRIKKEKENLKERSRRNEDEHHKKIQDLESETRELTDKVEKLESADDRAKLCNESLGIKIQNLEEEMRSLSEKKSQLVEKLKRKDEQLDDLTKETNTLNEENKRLHEHSENIDRILSLQNSAALDQASGKEKEINVLQNALAQLRTTADMNRAEIDELKRKLKTTNDDKMNTDVRLNNVLLQQERLQGKNDELLGNCARLEVVVKEGEQLRLEKEDKERLLEIEQQRNEVIEEKLASKSRELLEKEKVLENLIEEMSDYQKKIGTLNISKEGLIASVEELSRMNDEGVKELQITSEKNEQLLLEKKRLTELVDFNKDEMENLKKESNGIKTELQLKVQETENDKFQLQSDVKMKEENLSRLTKINHELQGSLKTVKEEVDDLENENEDLLGEVEQLKEVNKKAKDVICTLQTELSVLQEEIRDKENDWSEEKERFSLEIFKMESETTNVNDRLTQANERNEKQRELEKMLRLEIDELSDGYVDLEEVVQHRNDENLSLREKLQTLTQNIEELELSRDTACLLKEKRNCELLKSDKNVQRLEKHLKEKQKANKKLQKELDSVIEKVKFLELQLSSENELSGQRLKQIQDLQNSQRQVEEQLWKANRDVEKFVTEIETWRISSDSMKVRIEALEDELNRTANDKEMVSKLYKETQEKNETIVHQISSLNVNFLEKTAGFEKVIDEINNEKTELDQELNDLEKVLLKKSVEIAALEELFEDTNNKYEDSLLVTSLLHNDIQRKDGKIANLEDRKKQVTNSLADLDLKIEEIEVQAVRLETDNENLRKQIARVMTSEECLRQTIENERRIFTEKCETDSREIQQLKDTKENLVQLVLKANCNIEDKNSALIKIQADHEKLISDKHFILNTKKRLENELWETKFHQEKVTESLNVEKDKTRKQNLEIEHLSKDCQSLKTKCLISSEEQKEVEKKLMKANAVCQELGDCLEEKNAENVKIRERCENMQNKISQLGESLSVLTSQNEKILQIKNQEIGSLTATNRKLNNVIDEVKAKLDQQMARNDTNENENKGLKEKLEKKQERFNDLEVLYQNTTNSKDSLEKEKNGFFAKIRTISRDLETLQIEKQRHVKENIELNCIMGEKEKEYKERCDELQMAQQKLDEEIFDQKMTLENMLVENNDLQQKVNTGNEKLTETSNSLKEICRKLELQEKENKRLKLTLQNSNFERNVLAEVNSKVSNALNKLKTESSTSLSNGENDEHGKQIDGCPMNNAARNQTQEEYTPLVCDKKTSDEQGEPDYSWRSKQAFALKTFELQNNFSQIENKMRTLRTLLSNKENEVTHLEVSLSLLQNELDVLCSQLSNYMQKFEEECKHRENALENIKQLESDLEQLKEEKFSFAAESQEKLMHWESERLANELVIGNLRRSNAWLEDKIQEMETLNEEKTERIKELENVERTKINELEAVEKIIEKMLSQIRKLEGALYICEGKKDSTISRSGENNRMDKYDDLSSKLTQRFERVLENIQSQLKKVKRLEESLTDAETQSSIHSAELQASEIVKNNLKVECEQFQNKLSLVTSNHEDALCKAAELSKSLINAEDKMQRTRNSQIEENIKISQELQKMQRELVLACEKFNCSISKARSLEKKIETKEKRIADLEVSLQISGVNDRMHQIRIVELETTTEILFNTNKELKDAEKDNEEKMAALQWSLQQEEAARNEDISERDATIRQLELKNGNCQRQVVRYKELLTKAETTTKELQKELKTSQSRCKEIETTNNAEIADSESKILQLRQNVLSLEEDFIRVDNERGALAETNKDLLKSKSSVETENKDYKNILKQNKQEKEILNTSLVKMFDIALNEEALNEEALNEEARNDVNDQSKKLEKVIEVFQVLMSCKEKLTNEKRDALESVSKLEKENEGIRSQCRTKCEGYELLKQHSSKLASVTKNLANDLDHSKVKCEQLNTKMHELEENVETLRANENQQKYQYQMLEKEKEDLENEVICIEESMEKVTEKLRESVHLLNEFNPDTTSGNLDDSGIGIEESSMKIIPNREPLDSGVFNSSFDQCITFPTSSKLEDEKVENEKMRHLETTVNTCVQSMSKICSTFNERARLFSDKEQQLVKEIRVLEQTSVRNEDLLSSLEKEVERLEVSQTSLKETYQEKDENLKKCQMKLDHSITIANEKEMSITILNESVQEYKKRQKSLEKEQDSTKRANELLNKEKLQNTLTIQDYEKALEEHRQLCLENDVQNEKKTTSLLLKITELESQILEKENTNLELRHLCTTLRGTLDEIKNETEEYLLAITSYKDTAKDLEKQNHENAKRAKDLSQEVHNYKETIKMLETMCQEAQETSNNVKNKLCQASIDLGKSRREVVQVKEENIRIKLERACLIDDAEIRKVLLKEKEATIEHISGEISEKDELLSKNEAQLKLVKEFMQEINSCKDNLEKDVNELKIQNDDLRKQAKILKEKNNCLLESIKTKEANVIEKDNSNSELQKRNNDIKNELLANNAAHKEATDELRMSLAEAKRINKVIEDLNDLFDSNTANICTKTNCQEENTYSLLLTIGRNMNTLTFACQKILVERENLQKSFTEQSSFAEKTRNEKSVLEMEKQNLHDKVFALSEDLTEVKTSLRKQEQELEHTKTRLSTEKQKNAELLTVNSSLQEQIKLVKDDVSSISTHAESLKKDRKNLKELLLEAQKQVKSKYEQLDSLNEELRTARHTITELNNLQNNTTTAKEEVEMELEYAKQAQANLQNSQMEQAKFLSDAQVTLAQERERIITLTKLARIKEHDLENAKMSIKLKDELIGQMKEQMEEMKETNASSKEELEKVVTSAQQRNETLSNEKVCLWKDCALLKDRLQQVQKEKQGFEMKVDNESKKTSMALEKLKRQKQTITNLEDEVELQKRKYQHLENEKSILTNEAKDKEKRLELEYGELLDKAHGQNTQLENTLLRLKSELGLSESLRRELEQKLAENEGDFSALQDQNFELQAEIETCSDTIKVLNVRKNNLTTENNKLKETVNDTSDENERLHSDYEKEKQHLEILKTNLAKKELENDILQKKILSGKDIIYTLRNVAMNLKSEANDLKCKERENTKSLEHVNKELELERNTVSKLLQDKVNLEELYQNLETNMRNDLEDAKLQIDNRRNENLNLKKENTSLHCKVQEKEKTMKDLKCELQTISAEKLEVENKLTEERWEFTKANKDLHRVRLAVSKVYATARLMQNECRLDISTPEAEKHVETSYPSECSATDAIFQELRNLEIALQQIDTSFDHLLETDTTKKKNIKELTLVNDRLRDENENQEDKVKSLQDSQNNLLLKNSQLDAKNIELANLHENLEEKCKRVEELLSNECTITKEISNELTSIKDEKQRLCENYNELEVNLERCVEENVDLTTKQRELKHEIQDINEKHSSLEISYAALCQEKRKIDEKTLEMKVQILALESDLEAAVGFSELLENRFTEESENNTNLRVRVENLDSQVCVLENTLETSLSQIEEMNCKIVSMNEEIRHTGLATCEKENQIAQLLEKQKTNDEKLKESYKQAKHYKNEHENVLTSKKKTEEKLEITERLLEKSEKLLHQEKQSINDLTIEKKSTEQELQSTITKLQVRIDELMSDLSTATTKEETTKQNLDSTRDTIKELENNMKQQHKASNEELDNLKVKYTITKNKLDQTQKEYEDLHEDKRKLKKLVEHLDTKIALQCQESEQKLEKFENLEIQFAAEKKTKQNLQSEISRLQQDLNFLKNQTSEKQRQFECVVEDKNKAIDQMSEKLAEEINKTEELQSVLNTVKSEMRKWEQINKDKSQEILALCESLVNNLTSAEFKKSYDEVLLEGSFDNAATDLSKVIDVIRSSHTLMSDHNHHLRTKASELNKRLTEIEKENEALLLEKTELEDDLDMAQQEIHITQVNCTSLGKAFMETCQHDLEVKGNKVRTLEDEINEFKQRENILHETIECKEEEYFGLHTEMEVIEKNRVSLKEDIGNLQLKLGNTIIELTTAKTTNEFLESKNDELVFTNSRLLDDQVSFQNKLRTAENALSASGKETKELLEKLSLREDELSKLSSVKDASEKAKVAAQKYLEEKENEIIVLKENLNEIKRQKDDLENQMNKLNEVNKQVEDDKKDLQLTKSEIQADNSQLRRQIEYEQNENLTMITRLQCQLEKALTSLEGQRCKLSQVQKEKDIVCNQLLEAEKELKVLMEYNADLKHQMYQSKKKFSTVDKDELSITRCQVSELRHKEVVLSQENKCLMEQVRKKSEELRQLKLKEGEFTKEMEDNREKMRRYLSERDKWEEEVKSVISEIGSESTLHCSNFTSKN